jgi:hypothetical protein
MSPATLTVSNLSGIWKNEGTEYLRESQLVILDASRSVRVRATHQSCIRHLVPLQSHSKPSGFELPHPAGCIPDPSTQLLSSSTGNQHRARHRPASFGLIQTLANQDRKVTYRLETCISQSLSPALRLRSVSDLPRTTCRDTSHPSSLYRVISRIANRELHP